MRLRRKPWIGRAILELTDIVYIDEQEIRQVQPGCWREIFPSSQQLHVELGTGKGTFITQMALRHPEVNFIGIEVQRDVIYFAAEKARELGLTNVRFLLLDVGIIDEIFAPHEVDRLYINFCDPWPKSRHAKRRLTHEGFLRKYACLLAAGGQLHFKTDNRPLFDFSLEQFAAVGLPVRNISYDLHAEASADNIMTEYERKFSGLGEKINRCEVLFSE